MFMLRNYVSLKTPMMENRSSKDESRFNEEDERKGIERQFREEDNTKGKESTKTKNDSALRDSIRNNTDVNGTHIWHGKQHLKA
jgi:hypothetical protein